MTNGVAIRRRRHPLGSCTVLVAALAVLALAVSGIGEGPTAAAPPPPTTTAIPPTTPPPPSTAGTTTTTPTTTTPTTTTPTTAAATTSVPVPVTTVPATTTIAPTPTEPTTPPGPTTVAAPEPPTSVTSSTSTLPTVPDDPDDPDASARLGGAIVEREIVVPVVGPWAIGAVFNECTESCTRFHKGTDLLADTLQPVVSPVDGVVVSLLEHPAAGVGVVVRDDDGYEYRLYHFNNDTPFSDDDQAAAEWRRTAGVVVGARVAAGALIGFVGDSGNAASGPSRLGFEIRLPDGTPVDPAMSLDAAIARDDAWLCAPEGAVTASWLQIAGIAVSPSGFRPQGGSGCAETNGSTDDTVVPPTVQTSTTDVPATTAAPSAPVVAAAAAPSAPRSPAVTVFGTSVRVHVTAPSSNGGAAISGYAATCSSSNGGTTRSGTTAPPSTDINVYGLTLGRVYACWVRATNTTGTGPPVATGAFVARSVPAATGAPLALVSPSAGTGSGRVRLWWTAPASNGAAVTDYVIQRSPNGSSGWSTVNDGTATATWYTNSGLTNGARYWFRVAARNAAGQGPWSPLANAVPRTVPSAPGPPTVTVYATAVALRFVPSSSNGGVAITKYTATCTSNTGGTARSGSASASPISVYNLTSGNRYSCVVRATNAAGVGPASRVSTAFTAGLGTEPPPTGTAFLEQFSAPGSSSGNRNGGLSGARFSVARWRSEASYDGNQHVLYGPVPPNDVRVENGRVVLDIGSQNYGDTMVRINQPFDIAGRTGTVMFDTVLYRPNGADPQWWGWPSIMFLSQPYSAPSYTFDNSDGPTPRNGITLQFRLACGAPRLLMYRDGVETFTDSAVPGGNCSGTPAVAPGALNRIRLRISQTSLQVCASDANQTVLTDCWSFAVSLNFTRGFLYFGGHNHATVKYGGGPVWTSVFDNFSFDGPVLAAARVSQVNNGPGRDIGYTLPEQGTGSLTLTLPGVNLAGAGSGYLVLSLRADQISNGNDGAWRLNYRFNNSPAHAVPVPLQPDGQAHAGSLVSISISLSELRSGTNTLTLSGFGYYDGADPYVGNIDLVLT